MKTFTITSLLDQKKIAVHVFILLVALVTTAFPIIVWDNPFKINNIIGFLLLITLYMEAFIFLASKIFRMKGLDPSGATYFRVILKRFAIFFILCFLSALLIYIVFRGIMDLIYRQTLQDTLQVFFKTEFRYWAVPTLKGLAFGGVIFVFTQWLDALKRERKLREENLIFQHETLKSQVNPHFLFNSLNTLSSLITNNPGKAEQYIQKLSSIYRYILENSRKNTVNLDSEIEFVKEYFELFNIRDEGKIFLTIDVRPGSGFSILPVSLQILLENAIKHNMATKENPLEINISLEKDSICVRNNLQKMATGIRSTETGLKNLAARVHLITGKDLTVRATPDDFTVLIPLLK